MEPNPMNPQNSVPPTPPTPPVEPERPRRPRSVVGPAILILVGLAFLADNFNLLQFNVWEMMWRLWPVWLIAVGLDMIIGRRTSWGSWLALGIIVTIVSGAVWFGNNLGINFTGNWETTTSPAERITISEDLKDAKRATVQINSSVGEFRLEASDSTDKLVEGTVGRLNGERIDKDYYGSNGDMTFILKSGGLSIPNVNTRRGQGVWDLKLAKNLPMDLKVGTGVGEAHIDLTGLTLNRLDVSTGIGEVDLTLPNTGNFSVKMDNGIGQTTLRIPDGMEAKVRASKGIGSIEINGAFERKDGYWMTPNYENAQNRVDVEISGGIGEIQIRH
ncbi:MAG TPA: LiaF domain-containing protein [Symbiobacteriaceae bacterium]|nr:LiaF domain-containing protein [Symbiobacteriaceae bacterium]